MAFWTLEHVRKRGRFISFERRSKKIEERILINELLVRAMAASDDRVKRTDYMVGYFLNEDIRNATMNVITDSLIEILERNLN